MRPNMMAKRLATVVLLRIGFADVADAAGDAPWVYANAGKTVANADDQAATWTGLCATGKEQSPIDVVTASAVRTMAPVIETHFDATVSFVKNTGHGFQLFETNPVAHKFGDAAASEADSGGKGYSMIGGSKFNFYQVHWHTPSENTIDGVYSAMEAHFVHQLADADITGYHRLAVIGLMYELGNVCNTVLDEFWSLFPNDAVGYVEYTGTNPDLDAKLSAELTQGYYHWYGSLTTPPCTEGVSWNLLKAKETCCQAQVTRLIDGLKATQSDIGFNNRVPQPLNHRAVALIETGNPRPAATNTAILPLGAAKWIYAAEGATAADAASQTSTWGGLCVTGHEQSPIDINSKATTKTAKPNISTTFDTQLSYVKNTGHGFQLFETSPTRHQYDSATTAGVASSGEVKGHSMIGGSKFNFYQVHWHTPSENTIDGVHFALEAHFVHQLAASDIAGYHRLAVIGLMYAMGGANNCNTFLESFWSSFPTGTGAAAYTGSNPNFNEKLQLELQLGYYHWMGSLTTPPCTEGVSWNLLKASEQTCPEQVDALKAGLAATQYGIAFNNRVTQPLNHRVVAELTAVSQVQRTSDSLTQGQWKYGIELAAANGMYTQKATKDFLLCAKNMDVVNNKADMFTNMEKFEKNLKYLHYGKSDGSIAAAPSQRIMDQLFDVEVKWASLKVLLTDSIDTVRASDGTTDYHILDLLYGENLPTMTSSDIVAEEYKNEARVSGATVPPVNVDIAGRQRMLSQKMSKEALFVGLSIHTTVSLGKLSATMELFTDSHADIVRGVGSISEMPELDDMCTLYEMKTVNGKWNKMLPYITTILDSYTASDSGLTKIAEHNLVVLEEMNKALYMYTHIGENVCDPEHSMNEESWMNVQVELGKQRMETQRAISLFFQLVQGVDTMTARQDIDVAMANGFNSLRLVIEGSYYLNIPSPPSQLLLDQMMYAQGYWSKFQSHVENDLRVENLLEVDLYRTAYYGENCNTAMDVVAGMYVNTSLSSNSERMSVIVEISWRQMTGLQTIMKEALLISLATIANVAASEENYVHDTEQAYAVSIDSFTTYHAELLHGRKLGGGHRRLAGATPAGVEILYPSREFGATKQACVLTSMFDALNDFNLLKHEMDQLVHGEVEIENQHAIIEKGLTVRDHALGYMAPSATAYSTGSSSCTTHLSKKEWESGVRLSGKAALYFAEAQKNVFLISSGLCATWQQQADKALVEHTGFITDDTESPILAQAMKQLSDGWIEMGQNEDERSFALKTAYVAQNPNPSGSRDLYMFAPGNQAYHIAHKTHHATFRDTLSSKNYFDILLLDSRGNVVYTVNKGLEYATSVALKKDGQWRDTILGEAFRGAEHNAEEDIDDVYVTAWQPYGPNQNALSSFLAKAIRNEAGIVIGVYMTQMPPEAKPIECQNLLDHAISSFDQMLEGLEFGVKASDMPPPPVQSIADYVFSMYDEWQALKPILQGLLTVETVDELISKRVKLLAAADLLDSDWIEQAWSADKTVPGYKISLANLQMVRIQNINADIALMYMRGQITTPTPTYEELLQAMADYEATQAVLLNGKTGRRLNADEDYVPLKSDVEASTDPMVLKFLDDSESAFQSLKDALSSITEIPEGETAPVGVVDGELLRSTVEAADEATSAVEQSLEFFAAKMEIIVLEPLKILAPVPLTGSWPAGLTMRTTALLAQGTINDEQAILPGFSLTHEFFDDKCHATTSSQIVLREISLSEYVALGGAGCSSVCRGTAFIAASVRLPFLSYECAGAALSDTSEYSDFSRMGTVTFQAPKVIKEIGQLVTDWSFIEIISGDPSDYRDEANLLTAAFADLGFGSAYAYAYETEWNEMVDLMDQLRIKKRRQIFVLGTEGYFRKMLCASIVVEANNGISWLSQGSFRDGWWATEDAILSTYRKYVRDDCLLPGLPDAISDFKKGWNAIAATDEERYNILAALYITDEKENLDFIDSPEAYHVYHKQLHSTYRDIMVDRDYYDIFFFDTKGNMVYSVFKEADYATNFGSKKSQDSKYIEWQNSGLGDAYKLAMATPGVLQETPWTPYGPSGGAVASFLAMAIEDESGSTIGVYSAQMPPKTMSVEDVEKDCTREAVALSFEGAISFVGLGQPLDAQKGTQVPCFSGRTAEAFLKLLDEHLEHGYPLGDEGTKVPNAFEELKAHPPDATCVFAYAVKHLMAEGFSIHDIKSNTEAVYVEFVSYIKTKIGGVGNPGFFGASGLVKFSGNDKHAQLGVFQVNGGHKQLVGTCSHNGTTDLTVNGGPSNASWKPAFPDEPPPEENFPYWAFQIFLPILCICCPALGACIRSW